MAARMRRGFLDLLPQKGKTVWIERADFSGAPCPIYCLPLLAIGVGFYCLAGISLFDSSATDWQTRVIGALTTMFFGTVYGLGGIWSLYVRLDIPRTLPIEVLASKLGLSASELERAALEKGILPRYNVEGRDYYLPADFDAASLLRAAVSPSRPEHLVLPAGPPARPSIPEHLLRPAYPGARAELHPASVTSAQTTESSEAAAR